MKIKCAGFGILAATTFVASDAAGGDTVVASFAADLQMTTPAAARRTRL